MTRKFTLYKLFVVSTLLSFIGLELKAQDPHFSQFNMAPLQLNPAMAGVYEGQFRLGINYREQWGSILGPVAFQTYAVNFDFRIHTLREDYVALGLSILGDKAGEARYAMTQGHFTVGYMKKVFGGRGARFDQYLIGAAQLGFGQQNINWNSLRFSRQFDGQAFDPTLPNGETRGDRSDMYADLNAGIMWYGLFGDNKSIYGGISFHHLNAPNISFYGNQTESLYMRYTIHGGGEIPLSRELTVLPVAMIMTQGPAFQGVMGGANFRFTTREWDDVALRTGLIGRMAGAVENSFLTDAIIGMIAVEVKNWTFMTSYDINVSFLGEATGGRGAFEIALKYTNPEPRRRGLFCPQF